LRRAENKAVIQMQQSIRVISIARPNRAEVKWAPKGGAGASERYTGRSTIKEENTGPEKYESTGADGQVLSGHPYSSST
jgi:hypothetical protein